MRTASRLGFTTAVGFSDGDRHLPFVEEANLKVSLDGVEAGETYLHQDKVIAAAKSLGAHFLHPGYGFLSEKADFVERLQKEGIKFIGPSSEAMKLLGDKIGSRNFLKKAGIPLLPSYEGDDQSEERLLKEAKALDFPLLIKPSAGGGGKGMFIAKNEGEFLERLRSSKRVAQSAFGDARVFIERFIEKARHIEVQILGDESGHIKIFGERECSLQRNHQKVIEETPCIYLKDKVREKLFRDSKILAEEAGYYSAGTIEWIWDGDEGLYFLEVNTRLQVEHPVTEEVFGIDLVEAQIKVAKGESIKDFDFKSQGHSIEARICAEDPNQNFLPSSGRIERLQLPKGIRIDFGFKEKSLVSPYFDSMLGKIIATAPSREQALDKLKLALEETVIFGPTTNRGYLIQLLEDSDVRSGNIHTRLLESKPYRFDLKKAFSLFKNLDSSENLETAFLEDDLDYNSPWGSLPEQKSSKHVFYQDFGDKRFFHTRFADWSSDRPRKVASRRNMVSSTTSHLIKCPLPGKVVNLAVKEGDLVQKAQVLVVVEAMKMEHQLKADYETKVVSIKVKEGDRVDGDQILIELEEQKND